MNLPLQHNYVEVCTCLFNMLLYQFVQTQICDLEINDDLWHLQWYLNKSGAYKYDMNVLPAWRICVNGTGITVGVVDTGVQDHFDLDIDREISLGDIKNETPESLRHGTRVAGVIGARKNNNLTVGIAFGSKIADIKIDLEVFDPRTLTHNMNTIDVYSCSFANFHTGTKSYPLLIKQEDEFIRGTTLGRNGLGAIYVFATGNSGDENDLFRDSCAYDRLVTNRYVISVAGIQYDLSKVPNGEACSAMMVAAFTAKAGAVDHRIVTTDVGNSSTEFLNQNSAAAPMVSAAVALALSANKNLTYRDVMHLLVETSRSEFTELANYFTKNAANLSVSSYFGFGLLDIGALVTKSLTWQNVPIKRICIGATSKRKHIKNENHFVYISTCNITYLEHVEVSLRVRHSRAGQVQWVLISPYGTRSTVLPGRELDYATNISITVLTVQMWGENPNGYWKLEPTALYDTSLDGGVLESFNLSVNGFECTGDMRCLQAAVQDESQFTTPPPDVTKESDYIPTNSQPNKVVLVIIGVVAVVVVVLLVALIAFCYVKKVLCFESLQTTSNTESAHYCARKEKILGGQTIIL